MRWVGWLAVGSGCRGGGEDDDTGTLTDTDTDTDEETADTGTTPPPPCPWEGPWSQLSHDCAASEAISWEVVLGTNCELQLGAQRYGNDGTPYPPLCSTTERIELRYDEPSATWRATSTEQSQSLEGCYTEPVGEYPLGVVGIGLVEGVLTLDFAPSPWSLSECAATAIVLSP